MKRALDRLRRDVPKLGAVGALPGLETALADQAAVAVPTGLEAQLLAMHGATAAAAVGSSASLLAALVCAAIVVVGVAIWSGGDDPMRPTPEVASGIIGTAERGDTEGPAVRPLEKLAFTADHDTAATPSPPLGSPPGRPVPRSARANLPTARVTGRVIDDDDQPLADAVVTAFSTESAGKMSRFAVKGHSGADGVYSLDVPVDQGVQEYRLSFKRTDHLSGWGDAFDVKPEVVIRREPRQLTRSAEDRPGTYTLDVRVQDSDGRPVAGVVVGVARRLKTGQGHRPEGEAHGKTGPDGSVSLEGTHIGPKILTISPLRTGYLKLTEGLAIPDGGWHERVVVVERGGEISGTVVDVHGQPVSDIGVNVVRGNDWRWARVRDGRFRCAGLEPGPWKVRFGGDRYSRCVVEARTGADDLRIVAKRRHDVRDHGHHMAELHGIVVDHETNQVVQRGGWGLDVDLRLVSPEMADWTDEEIRASFLPPIIAQRAVQRERDGEVPVGFHKTGLRPGRYVIDLRHYGYAPAILGPFDLGPTTIISGIEIRLHRPLKAAGRVVGPDGRPVKGAFVFSVVRGPRSKKLIADRDAAVVKMKGRGTAHFGGFVRSGVLGRFDLGRLPTDFAIALVAVHPDHGPSNPVPVVVDRNGKVADLKLHLRTR
ncbi:MAG: hypothetical protein CMJ83_09335 [Planctomycetes bacterium]|nr:hypothetical protein [Planctomycetota bacterium]